MSACLGLADDGLRVAVPFRLVRGAASVAVQIQHRLITQRGYHPDDRGLGLRWDYYREYPGTPDIEIEGDVRSQLREIEGVISVTSVTLTRSGSTLTIEVVAKVRHEDGTPTTVVVGSTERDGWWAFASAGVLT